LQLTMLNQSARVRRKVAAIHRTLTCRFWVMLQVSATILKIIGERMGTGRRALDNQQRSYFVTCFAFVRLVLGFAPLLLNPGVCADSVFHAPGSWSSPRVVPAMTCHVAHTCRRACQRK
jgi:hypothetical protein